MNVPSQLKEKLESRWLFDGVPFVPHDIEPESDLSSLAAAEVSTIQTMRMSSTVQSTQTMAELTLLSTAPGTRNEIVVIDTKIDSYQAIADLLNANGYKVHLIHETEAGVTRLRQIVSSYNNIDALHIFANGHNARLDLGREILADSLTPNNNNVLFGAMASHFNADGDTLIYTSSLAQDSSGRNLVQNIGVTTRTDVLAASNSVGSLDYGGTWNLDFAYGSVESNIIRIGGYEGVFSVPTLKTDFLTAVPNSKTVLNLLANDSDPRNISSPFTPGDGPLTVTAVYDPHNPLVRLSFEVGTTLRLQSGTVLTNLGNGNVEVTLAHGHHMEERIRYETSYFGRTASSTLVVQRDSDGDGVNDMVDIDDDNDGILDEVETGSFISPGTIGVIDKLEGTTALYSTYSEIDVATQIRWSYVAITNPFTGAVTQLSPRLNFQINAFAYNDQTDTFFAMVNSFGDLNGLQVQRGDILEIDRNGEIFFVARPNRFTSSFHPDNAGGGARSGVFLDGVMYVMPNNATGVTQLYSVDVATGATQAYRLSGGVGLGYHVADMVEINGVLYGVGRNYRATSEIPSADWKSPFYLTRIDINGLSARFVNKEFFGVPHVTDDGSTPANPVQNYNFDAQWAVRNGDGSYSILFSSVTDRNLYRIDNYLDDVPIAYLVADGKQRTDTYDGANSGLSLMYADDDGDGIPNHLDIDSDNDGIPDNIEAQSTAGYIAPLGIVNEFGLDLAYVGTGGITPVDTDSDGIADYLDVDSDNDGLDDIKERGDGRPQTLPTSLLDSDFDGLLDIFEKVDVNGGINPSNSTSPNRDSYSGDTRLQPDGSNAVPLLLDLDFRKVNAPPTGSDGVVVVDEDQLFRLRPGDFGFADVTESNPHTLINIEIVRTTGEADLYYDGALVLPGTILSVADIAMGRLVWRARENVNGTHTGELVFHVQDSGGTANGGIDRSLVPNTLTLSVTAVDDPPVSLDLSIQTNEDNTYRGNLPSASDVDSSVLTYRLHGDGAHHGEVVILEDGTFAYTPKADFHGTDEFEFSVTDGGNVVVHQVRITVNPVDDAVDNQASIPWNTSVELDILKNDYFSSNTRTLQLDNNTNWVYSERRPISDLNIYPGPQENQYIIPGSLANNLIGAVFTSDSNRLIDQVRFSWTLDEANAFQNQQLKVGGVITDASGVPILGNWLPIPGKPMSQTEMSSVSLVQVDLGGRYEFVFQLSVPMAANQIVLHVALEHNSSGTPSVLASLSGLEFVPRITPIVQVVEIDGHAISSGQVISVANGSVTLNDSGNVVFTPERDYFGTTSFNYTALSGGIRESAVVYLDVVPVPRAVDDHYFVGNRGITSSVLGNDNFFGRSAQPIDLVSQPVNGILNWSSDGNFTYIPNEGFVGLDTFVYEIRDGGAQATVYLNTGFGKDSFTDLSQDALKSPFDLSSRMLNPHWERYDRAWVYHAQGVTQKEDPILAGNAVPGTVLVGRIYDQFGTLISQSASQTNQAGNWMIQFWNVPSGLQTRVVIEQVAIEQSAFIEFNDFKVTQDLYRSSLLEARYDCNSNDRQDSNHGDLQSRLPVALLHKLHDQNLSPLKLL